MSALKELPLDTLNLSELAVQFKIMRALGYHSLFDVNFRRELRNPFRKHLYYRIVVADEMMSQHTDYHMLKTLVDRLSFFVNPELYRKFKEQENIAEMQDAEVYQEKVKETEAAYSEAIQKYIPPTAEEQVKIREILAN